MPREEVVPVDLGAEAFVELLNAHDVDCIFLNSGTDTFPVQEAISKFDAQGIYCWSEKCLSMCNHLKLCLGERNRGCAFANPTGPWHKDAIGLMAFRAFPTFDSSFASNTVGD